MGPWAAAALPAAMSATKLNSIDLRMIFRLPAVKFTRAVGAGRRLLIHHERYAADGRLEL
jgi:3-hydroxymyristoyl/3-hydroxydecanoyl-(acyl carrier protein) dehydratase